MKTKTKVSIVLLFTFSCFLAIANCHHSNSDDDVNGKKQRRLSTFFGTNQQSNSFEGDSQENRQQDFDEFPLTSYSLSSSLNENGNGNGNGNSRAFVIKRQGGGQGGRQGGEERQFLYRERKQFYPKMLEDDSSSNENSYNNDNLKFYRRNNNFDDRNRETGENQFLREREGQQDYYNLQGGERWQLNGEDGADEEGDLNLIHKKKKSKKSSPNTRRSDWKIPIIPNF